jgi:hypothetical protein
MTQIMSAPTLRRIARVSEQPVPSISSYALVLRWSIDSETGRPISCWMLADEQAFKEYSLLE